MNTPLNNDTQQKARDLARQITVAHDLDPEIQEELYGHIEDKLLAYKSGEERISDEDAFILVREHFGDAKVIRGLLQEVHEASVHVGIVRRIFAYATTVAALQSVVTLLHGVLIGSLAMIGAFNGHLEDTLPATFKNLAVFIALFYTLRHWRKQELSGGTPWYARLTLPHLFKWLGIAIAMTWIVPSVVLTLEHSPGTLDRISHVAANLLTLGLLLTSCLIWLWWTDATLRRWMGNLTLGILWALWITTSSVYPAKAHIAIGHGVPSGSSTFAHRLVGEIPVTAFLSYGGPFESGSAVLVSLIAGTLVAFVSCVVGAAWHQFRRHRLHSRHVL